MSDYKKINSIQQWYPIALETDRTGIQAVRLLNQDLVLWRSTNGLMVTLDRCPHRSAKLSLGWSDEHHLVCPYHGLAYDQTGRCVAIPAHPDLTPPSQLQITRLPLQQAYGLIWTALEPPTQKLPIFPQWHSSQYRQLICGPYYYKASAYRAMENFLDVAHFPFVHEGLLGDRTFPRVEPYRVTISSQGLETSPIQVWQPDPDATGKGSYTTYRYYVHYPLMASFSKTTTAGEFFMFLALTPLSDIECLGWMGLAMNYGHDISETEIKAFQDHLVKQDIAIVESQSPVLPSLTWHDECPLPSDKLVISYRQWLRDLI